MSNLIQQQLIGTAPKHIEGTATYTITGQDAGGLITIVYATAITVTIPEQSTEALPTGFTVTVQQGGDGQITFVTEGVDALFIADDLVKTRAKNTGLTLIKRSQNEWAGFGDLTA